MVRVSSTRFLSGSFYPERLLPLTVSPRREEWSHQSNIQGCRLSWTWKSVSFAMAISEEMEPHLQLAEQDIGVISD